MKNSLHCLIIFLLTSLVFAQPKNPTPKFELGGGVIYLMPREDYKNGWGVGLNGSWNFSSSYGLIIACGSTNVPAESGDSSKTVQSVIAGIQIHFRPGESVVGFTSIGMGFLSDYDDPLFVFSGGFRVHLHKKWGVMLEIKDYHTDIGIPFFTFPRSRIAVSGQGMSRYLELKIGINYLIGKTQSK
ncbi:MAG: hypothetical protein H8E82_06820 [Candidatus Marinimicrobia bacterium]|nr:hypothetical protein [Candidatus Neomarinimicrobiota bacterium]